MRLTPSTKRLALKSVKESVTSSSSALSVFSVANIRPKKWECAQGDRF